MTAWAKKDANGNQIAIQTTLGPDPLRSKQMAYDLFNRMTSWAKKNANGTVVAQETHTYPAGRRDCRWRASHPCGLQAYVSMTDHTGATPQTWYHNQDERSSVRNLTDATGAIAATYDYTAFGETVTPITQPAAPKATITQRYQYTGREHNPASGNHYFRYRTYTAGLGKFVTRDPLGYFDGPTLYAGAFAEGLGRDPWGLWGVLEEQSTSYGPGSAVLAATRMFRWGELANIRWNVSYSCDENGSLASFSDTAKAWSRNSAGEKPVRDYLLWATFGVEGPYSYDWSDTTF